MENYNLTITNEDDSHEIILKKCNDLVNHFNEFPDSKIIFDLSGITFIYPDYALLILCTLKCIEINTGKEIHGTIRVDSNSNAIKYLNRMNFFRHLDVEIPANFKIQNGISSIEIQNYNEENQIEVCQSILKMIKTNSNIDDNVYASLDYCFNEVLDNVLLHSETKQGWVVAQYFPNLSAIRLMVCDYGIGVKNALNIKYNFNDEEALLKCIEKGITNGKGQGHGLFATSKFIELNQGWLSIISGNKKLDINGSNYIKVKDSSYWQGTCVYLRINTNLDVDYTQFTSENYDYKEQLFEDLFS